jgi:1-acyl-sn-glycerol-3-phosphate acyltransferase
VGIGALLCEVVSRRHVDIGLVPLGTIGMTAFAVDLYFAARGLPPQASLLGAVDFMATPVHWRVMLDLFFLSLFTGIYSVPMYALIQLRTPPSHRARIIAANNILNALFMIASSLGAGFLLGAGLSIPELFLVVGLLNALVASYVFLLVPEYLLRFFAFVLTRCIYRFRVQGEHHLPTEGAALLVCNHVSYVDAVLLMAASPRPVRFLMDHRIFATPVLGWLFKLVKAIPVAPQGENPQAYEQAFVRARQALDEGELVCIFPEGRLTHDGALGEFKPGALKLLQTHPVPVVPMALGNLWGSFFSRVEGGTAMVKPFRRGFFSAVSLNVGPAVPAASASTEGLRSAVAGLLAAAPQR